MKNIMQLNLMNLLKSLLDFIEEWVEHCALYHPISWNGLMAVFSLPVDLGVLFLLLGKCGLHFATARPVVFYSSNILYDQNYVDTGSSH